MSTRQNQDMENTRTDRMRMLLRKNTGHRHMADFRRETAMALGRAEPSLDVVPLEETDTVWNRFGAARTRALENCGKPGYHCLTTGNRRELEEHAAKLAAEFPPTDMLLFRSDREYCGAVRGNSTELFDRMHFLIEFDGGEDLLACSEDASAGIFAAWYEDRGREIFVMQAWYGAASSGHIADAEADSHGQSR